MPIATQTNDRQHADLHKTEYYSALKQKEILSSVIMWVNLENTRLSLINESQPDTFIETGSRMAVMRGLRKGGNELLSDCHTRLVLRDMSVMVLCTQQFA